MCNVEFKEFSNPESEDYDINSSLNYSNNSNVSYNPYTEQLMNLIGILEDITDADLQERYGISEEEYLHPTSETMEKVKDRLNSRQKHI